jgi:histidine triad (HIT) family protein
LAGDEPGRIVYRDEDVTAFHDRSPQAPVHVLIIPNRHIESVNEIETGDAALIGGLLLVARRVAEKLGVESGYRLVINTGRRAGQSVPHLHVHLLAGRALSWPPG